MPEALAAAAAGLSLPQPIMAMLMPKASTPAAIRVMTLRDFMFLSLLVGVAQVVRLGLLGIF